jgi:hypothetical protein
VTSADSIPATRHFQVVAWQQQCRSSTSLDVMLVALEHHVRSS